VSLLCTCPFSLCGVLFSGNPRLLLPIPQQPSFRGTTLPLCKAHLPTACRLVPWKMWIYLRKSVPPLAPAEREETSTSAMMARQWKVFVAVETNKGRRFFTCNITLISWAVVFKVKSYAWLVRAFPRDISNNLLGRANILFLLSYRIYCSYSGKLSTFRRINRHPTREQSQARAVKVYVMINDD
jgi:hypothetical protein